MKAAILCLALVVLLFLENGSGARPRLRSRAGRRMRNRRYRTTTPAPEIRPGIKARITQRGFDFASDLAMDVLMLELGHLRIPDVKETVGVADVTASNIQIVDFPRPDSHLESLPGFGIRWQGTNMHPFITADYSAKFEFGFWTVVKTGSMSAQGRDLAFTVDFFIGRNRRTGLPIAEVFSCSCHGRVSLAFQGGWSEMLNIGSSVFQEDIEGLVGDKICDKVKKEINMKLNNELAKIPVRSAIDNSYEIDYHLVKYPEFVEGAVETYAKGTVYPKGSNQDPPMEPPLMPVVNNHTDKMFYAYVTDYAINSGFSAAFHNEEFMKRVHVDMLPQEAKVTLNTSCSDADCLGTVFPRLAARYPGAIAEIDVFATHPPHVSVANSTFSLNTRGEAEFFVSRHPGRPKDFVFSTTLSMSVTVSVEILDDRIVFNVSDMNSAAEIKESTVGRASSDLDFENFLRSSLQTFLLPVLTGLGSDGIPFPQIPDVEFLDLEIIRPGIPNVVIVGGDVAFNYTLPSFS